MAETWYFNLLNEHPITLIIITDTREPIRKLSPSSSRWSPEILRETYHKLEADPITTESYSRCIPPKLERRYIVTGGSGLVGGYIVLQLLERGQTPKNIRIVDFRAPNRHDMIRGPAADVDFVQADISSSQATKRAFWKAWDSSVAHLPLTVFHTAAIIVPSERSKLVYSLCKSVNVHGTQNVIDAARQVGADVLVSTTSGSISVRRVKFWMSPWKLWGKSRNWPRNYWQVLDEDDFFMPPRNQDEYYANYPASKAAAERIVCGANSPDFRTGCIRPANDVYGNPTDNTVGGPLNNGDYPTWTSHTVQSFVHGANAAIAHLHFEAILAPTPSSAAAVSLLPQSGRPFVVTDPNPPITYGDLYQAISTLTTTHFRAIPLTPVLVLLLSHLVKWYVLLPHRFPLLPRGLLPVLRGPIRFLQPAIMDICTHLVASNSTISQPAEAGKGLGYTGVITTLEGIVQEVVEWNREHREGKEAAYQLSISLPEQLVRGGGAMLEG